MKYTRGWIRMQVMSAMVDIRKWVPGIANSDTGLTQKDVLLLISHLSAQLGRNIEWKCVGTRHTVSTVVEYLEKVLNEE